MFSEQTGTIEVPMVVNGPETTGPDAFESMLVSNVPFAVLAIQPGDKVFAFRKTENKIVETTVKEVTVVANADGQKVQVKVDGFQRVLPVDQIFLTREAVMESVVSGMFQ